MNAIASITIVTLMCMMTSTASAQERLPSGRIPGELQPFIALDGISVELNGITNVVYHVPAKDVTGLSQQQLDELERAIQEDIAAALRSHGVPLRSNRESEVRQSRLGAHLEHHQSDSGKASGSSADREVSRRRRRQHLRRPLRACPRGRQVKQRILRAVALIAQPRRSSGWSHS